MTAPDISQFEPADPAPAGRRIPVMAPAAARTAAGQSLSGLSAGRRPEFDVMRGFVVAGLVVFHSAVVFASGASWFVTDPQPSAGFAVFLLWGSLWGMPLLFLVSGMGARYAMRTALRQRSPGSGWPGCWSRSYSGWWCWFRRCSISKGAASQPFTSRSGVFGSAS